MVLDRRISQRYSDKSIAVIDEESNKLVIVQCHGALFAVAYTGVAVADRNWMDCVIADSFAHRKLASALIQVGARHLARPAYALIYELQFNLNGALNADTRSRAAHLELLIQGWEFGKNRLIPFSCLLARGPVQANGNRYFELSHNAIAKFFRENPVGLWGQTIGDGGGSIVAALNSLGSTTGLTHDDVERYIVDAVKQRSSETETVGPSCVAVQIDPRISDGQVQFTYYPHESTTKGHRLLTPWVMTPSMICAPSAVSSVSSSISECGCYSLGGFSDGNTNLHVVTRLPTPHVEPTGVEGIAFRTLDRAPAP